MVPLAGWRTAVAALLVATGGGCSGPTESAAGPVPVALLTDAPWHMPKGLLDAFERQSGIKLVVREVGADAGALTERLTRGGGERFGDVAFGSDAATVPRALKVFEPC